MNVTEYNKSVEDFSGRIFRFSKKLVQDEDAAADVVQDCYLKLWENLKKVENEKVKSWLFTTAYRKSLLIISLSKRKSESEHLDSRSYEMPSCDLKQVIEDSLEKLPEIQRSVLMLRDYEGYDYSEIGKILELNESQVKVYLFRARSKMQEIIKDLNLVI